MRFFQGLENEFETAMVNKPSMFEPLKFNCSMEATFFPESLQTLESFSFLLPLNALTDTSVAAL